MASKSFYTPYVAKHIRLRLDCSSKKVSGGSDVTCALYIEGYTFSGRALKGSNVTINGKVSYFEKAMPSGSSTTQKWYLLHSYKVHVPYSGSKKINVSGYWLWRGHYGGYDVTDLTVKGSFTLDTIDIIPGKPGFSISSSGTSTTVRLKPEDKEERNYTSYAGRFSGSGPSANNGATSLTFKATKGTDANKTIIHAQYKRYGVDWKNAKGYPKETLSTTREFYEGEPSSGNNYNVGDRYGNKNVYWRAWAESVSSTGHKKAGDYHYYVYNDCPYPDGEGAKASIDSSNVYLTMPGVNIGLANNATKYYQVKYRKNSGKWVTATGKTTSSKVEYSHSTLGLEQGDTCQFAIGIGDQLEWNDHVWIYSNEVTAPIIPSAPTITFNTKNKNTRNYTDSSGTWVTYGGWVVNDPPGQASVSNFYFVANDTGNHSTRIEVEKYENGAWGEYDTTHSTVADHWFDMSGSSENNYNSQNRLPNRRWRARSVVRSSTGHEAASDFTYFAINGVPRITQAEIRGNLSTVTVSWGWADVAAADAIKYAYLIANIKRNGKLTSNTVGSVTGTSASVSLSSIGAQAGDTVYFSVRAGDEIEWNELQSVNTNEIPINTPPTVEGSVSSSAKSMNNFFGDVLSIFWQPSTDANNDILRYKIRMKKDNGLYQDLATVNDVSYSVNCDLIEKGSKVTFAVKAMDPHGGESGWIYSDLLTKSSNPKAPANINLTITNGHGDIIEELSTCTWNKVIQANGMDANYYVIETMYWDGKVYTGSSYRTSSTNINVSSDFNNTARGGEFLCRVKTVDSFGYESLFMASRAIKRNKVPTSPKSFRYTEEDTTIKGTASMMWEPSEDEDVSSVKYSVELSKNKGAYSTVATSLVSTTFTHNVKDIPYGTVLTYRVRAIDRLGVYSEYSYTSPDLVINTPSGKPSLIFPKKSMYSTRPRICVEVGSDADKHHITLFVKVNGVEYSSANPSHRELFNKSVYASGDKASFSLNKDLPIGKTSIEIRTKDKLDYSGVLHVEYARVQSIVDYIGRDESRIVTARDVSNLLSMVKDTEVAYRENRNVSKDNLIYSSIFRTMQEDIIRMQNKLNSTFPGLTRNISRPAIQKDGKITKEIFNTILSGVHIP